MFPAAVIDHAGGNVTNRGRPVFSVVMPAFNAERTIEAALDSIRVQTFADWEVIVVDDQSTDRTRDLVVSAAKEDPRISLISSPDKLYVAGARNLAMQAARGRYVSFLDSDDIWYPDKLERQFGAFRSGASVVFSSYHRLLPDGRCFTVRASRSAKPRDFLWGNPIGNLTGAFDRDALGLVFQEAIGHEDYLMWYRLVSKAGDAISILEPLARYTVMPTSLSGKKLKAASWHWAILRHHMKLGIVASTIGFVVYSFLASTRRLKEYF